MRLEYAADRLEQAGWKADGSMETDLLSDGRRIPSVLAVYREFARGGMDLQIKHNLMFSCYRATWAPVGEPLDDHHAADERHGTVVGGCEREAAVYALAQLREAVRERVLTTV